VKGSAIAALALPEHLRVPLKGEALFAVRCGEVDDFGFPGEVGEEVCVLQGRGEVALLSEEEVIFGGLADCPTRCAGHATEDQNEGIWLWADEVVFDHLTFLLASLADLWSGLDLRFVPIYSEWV
jgi:hypothetical protein